MTRSRALLFVDASAGAAGDMFLGALIDLGLPAAHLRRSLKSLPVEGWTLRSRRIERCGLAARKVDVRVRSDSSGRGWRALKKIVASADLSPAIRDRALHIFRGLIDAEARAHGKPFEKVHLHEAGGIDAIIDVVGACVGLEYLGVERVVVSPMTTGFGTVRCAHGTYPVPGPATLNLVRGCPVQAGPIEAERLTPTGAAILTGIADSWGELPPMRPRAIGYGAGDHDLGDTPNLLRLVLGDEGSGDTASAGPPVCVIECTIDDSTPQALAWTAERLGEAGALDVVTAAVTMKKGRSGHHLTVLGPADRLDDLATVLLRETTTLGLRFRHEQRIELERRVVRVRTPHGNIRVKVGSRDGETLNAWPEYEDCAAAARRHGVPLQEVQGSALECWRRRAGRKR